MKELTKRQTEVLDFIIEHVSTKGYAPTHVEIAKHLGAVSSRTAGDHLDLLQKKGYIKITPETPRGIKVLQTKKYTDEELFMPIVDNRETTWSDYTLIVRGEIVHIQTSRRLINKLKADKQLEQLED